MTGARVAVGGLTGAGFDCPNKNGGLTGVSMADGTGGGGGWVGAMVTAGPSMGIQLK